MKRTLYIPDYLWAQLDEYLQHHPDRNASSVVQEALADKLAKKDPLQFLEVAGLLEHLPADASENEEWMERAAPSNQLEFPA